MLIVSRREAEQIVIDGGRVRVAILGIHGGRVRLGITASPEIPVTRAETLLRGDRPPGLDRPLSGDRASNRPMENVVGSALAAAPSP